MSFRKKYSSYSLWLHCSQNHISPSSSSGRRLRSITRPIESGMRCGECGTRGGRRNLSPARIGMSRSEEHTSELQSLMSNSYAVFCLKKKIDDESHADDIKDADKIGRTYV